MKRPLELYQTILLAGWVGLWVVGSVLPGSFGSVVYSFRNVTFILLSGLTLWMGYRMAFKREVYSFPYLDVLVRWIRKSQGARQSELLARRYKSKKTPGKWGRFFWWRGEFLCWWHCFTSSGRPWFISDFHN
jgi:hypothetical protein